MFTNDDNDGSGNDTAAVRIEFQQYVPSEDDINLVGIAKPRRGPGPSEAWVHFDKLPGFLARCKYCQSELSYRTTITNLKKHVIRKHQRAWDLTRSVKIIEKKNVVEERKYSKQNDSDQEINETVVSKNNIDQSDDTQLTFKKEEKGDIGILKKRLHPSLAWDHFIKISSTIAECKYCQSKLSFKTTVSNLKNHLRSRHNKIWEYTKAMQAEMGYSSYFDPPRKRKRNYAWDYFIKKSRTVAKCKICLSLLSFRSTVGNLKRHLMYKHKKAYKAVKNSEESESDGIALLPSRKTTEMRDSSEEDENDDDNNENTKVKFSSEIWRQFEHEDEETKCKLCKETVEDNIEHMKNHLEEHHTTLLDDIISKAQKGLDSDSDDNDNSAVEDDNVYTEIVYLEDDPLPTTVTSKKRQPSKPVTKYQHKRQRVLNTAEDVMKLFNHESATKETPVPQEKAQDDLEVFLNYIRSLLKQIPKEVAPKLHLDIINLIVNTQIQSQTQQNIVIETVNYDTANAYSSSNFIIDKSDLSTPITPNSNATPFTAGKRIVTVPLQNLIKQINENTQNNSSVYELTVSKENTPTSNINTSSISMPSQTQQHIVVETVNYNTANANSSSNVKIDKSDLSTPITPNSNATQLTVGKRIVTVPLQNLIKQINENTQNNSLVHEIIESKENTPTVSINTSSKTMPQLSKSLSTSN